MDSGVASDLRRRIEEALSRADQPAAVFVALGAVAHRRIGVGELYTQVLGPLLDHVGQKWQGGRTRVWEEHLASATVRIVVDALFPVVFEDAASVPRRGFAVLACPPEEQHDIGLRMLADRLALAGWHPRFLGADTPVVEIVAAARALGAELVVLSASTHFGRVRLAGFVEEIRAELPDTRIVVGGAAFDRGRDGWASTDFLTDADLTPLPTRPPAGRPPSPPPSREP